MNLQNDPQSLALMKFGIGQPVPRSEDPILVRGEGRYTDDVKLPGEAYAVMVRSRHAHGIIKGIDTAAARAMPGVLGVYTGADLTAYGTLKCIVPFNNRDGSPMKKPPRPALPTDKVRFVGDPVAFVVAETPLQAKDAAEAVEVDIDPLPAVTRPEDAVQPGAPLIYDDAPGNVALDYHYGDSEQVAAAFAKAAHVTRLKLVNSRLVVNAMEPRAAIGVYEPASGRWTLHAPSQGVFGMKGNMADILKVEPKQVRILTGNVGGSFGMKAAPFPEYVCVLHAARALGRPVKWTDERSGSFVSDSHGRDHELTAELALDADGTFLALRLDQLRQHGRLPLPGRADAVDAQRREERAERLPHAADRGVDQVRVHQHLARLGLSRRRPAGGQLLHGAADRSRRRRAGDRPGRAAAAQPDPAARAAAQDRLGHDLRQRRLPGRAQARARSRRRQGLQPAQAREPQARQGARARHRQLPRGHRAALEGDGRHPVRGRRHGVDHHRHARLRPGPRRRRSRRC